MSNELAIKDEAVLAFFKESSAVDMGDVGEGQTPTLSLLNSQSQVIKEEKKDVDGKDLKVGNFYLNVLNEQYATVPMRILYVKKTRLPNFTNPDVKDLTYIIGGMMVKNSMLFLLYVKSMSLNQLWNLQKELTAYTSHPQYPIPSFALTVELSTCVRESKNFGKVKAIDFQLVKTDKGQALLETDMETLQKLKAAVPKMQEAIERLVVQDKQSADAEFDDSIPLDEAAAALA